MNENSERECRFGPPYISRDKLWCANSRFKMYFPSACSHRCDSALQYISSTLCGRDVPADTLCGRDATRNGKPMKMGYARPVAVNVSMYGMNLVLKIKCFGLF